MQQQARDLVEDMEYWFDHDEQYVLAVLYDEGDYAAVVEEGRRVGAID